jgi:hypothetical protein
VVRRARRKRSISPSFRPRNRIALLAKELEGTPLAGKMKVEA